MGAEKFTSSFADRAILHDSKASADSWVKVPLPTDPDSHGDADWEVLDHPGNAVNPSTTCTMKLSQAEVAVAIQRINNGKHAEEVAKEFDIVVEQLVHEMAVFAAEVTKMLRLRQQAAIDEEAQKNMNLD